MYGAVDADQSVRTEISVAAVVVVLLPKIARIELFAAFYHVVVAPFPYERAAQLAAGIDEFPIGGDVSAGISHRVRIFAQNERFVHPAVEELSDILAGRIHPAAYIEAVFLPPIVGDGIINPLVVHGTAVQRVDRIRRRLGIAAPARFVAHRPDDDGRPVLVARNHSLGAVNVQLLPRLVCGQIGKTRELGGVVVLQNGSVRFQIGFL